MIKKILIVFSLILIVWFSIFALDLIQVKNFNEPIFCVLVKNEEDFKKYVGIGYSVDLEYERVGIASLYTLTTYNFELLGKTIAEDYMEWY